MAGSLELVCPGGPSERSMESSSSSSASRQALSLEDMQVRDGVCMEKVFMYEGKSDSERDKAREFLGFGFWVLGGEDKWGTRKAINKERNVVGIQFSIRVFVWMRETEKVRGIEGN